MESSKLYMLLALFALVATTGLGQNVNVVQPKIMVIPYAKDGEDLRNLLETDFDKREAVTKIKNAFDKRGFTTKDFVATVKQAKDAGIFKGLVQSEVKSAIINLSGADIYVEADINMASTGKGSEVKVLLTAYDSETANAYANIVCDSRERYNNDKGVLTDVALSTPARAIRSDEDERNGTAEVPCLDDFLNILQAKFTDMLNKGRPVKVDFSVAADAAHNFDSKIKTAGDKQLSDIIDDWISENAFKNNYHMQGQSSAIILYDEVRLPIYDANGNNYKLNKFAQRLSEFLQSKGISTKRAMKNGGVYITITN